MTTSTRKPRRSTCRDCGDVGPLSPGGLCVDCTSVPFGPYTPEVPTSSVVRDVTPATAPVPPAAPVVTFAKLRSGAWGVRVLGMVPSVDAVVTVTKRNGDTQHAVIRRVVWSGKDDRTGQPVALCVV